LLAYCTIPAVCLLTGKFIIPTVSTFGHASIEIGQLNTQIKRHYIFF
jgi:hypothetical protein